MQTMENGFDQNLQSKYGHSYSRHNHSLVLSRPSHERGIFRAAKELFRFVTTTIVVANASKCTANAASIIANYHRTAAARSTRRSTDHSSSLSLPKEIKENNINLWHFSSLSICSPASGCPLDDDDLEGVFTGADSGRSGRSTRNSSSFPRKDLAVVTSRIETHPRNANAAEEYYEQPSTLAEMRAQLGPIGLLVANAVEVGITTAGSYMSGGIFGYFVGGAMGIPGVFRGQSASVPGPPPMKSAAPNAGMKEIQRRIGDWNSKALAQGKSWGALSASFSGFHALARVCRGGVEDRWNGIIGSAATGAYLSRQGGPQAMLQGASTYAGFTYILDQVFGSETNTKRDREFEFTDTPVDERGY